MLVTRALTVHRPWSWALVHSSKCVENRTWKPPASLIGTRIALHAGKTFDKAAAEWIEILLGLEDLPLESENEGIVGTARLVGVVEKTGDDGLRLVAGEPGSLGNLTPLDVLPWLVGPYGWLFDDRRPIERPIACRGMQGVWTLPTPIEVA